MLCLILEFLEFLTFWQFTALHFCKRLNYVLITCNLFSHIKSKNNGGAINIVNDIGSIVGNRFFDCSTSLEGGAMYIVNGTLNILYNYFKGCFNYHSDNVCGNIIRSIQGALIFTTCSAYLCGPSEEKCGDSTIALKDQNFNVSNFNCSDNFGINGGNLGNYYSIGSCYISFSQCFHGKGDWSMAELVKDPVILNNCNFVNDSKVRYSITTITHITIKSCVFIDCQKPLIGSEIEFIDSYSNLPFSNLNSTTDFFQINYFVPSCSYYNTKECSFDGDTPMRITLICTIMPIQIFIHIWKVCHEWKIIVN